MLNRNTPPALTSLREPTLLPYERLQLANGVEIVYMHDPRQQAFKIDAVFEAGVIYQSHPLVASTTVEMLGLGTSLHNAEEIADLFDYYGAYIDFSCGLHKAEVNLFSLAKYAKETIAMMLDTLQNSVFPRKEQELLLTNKRQEYLIHREKTSWLARKKFAELLFGADHPYANKVRESDFEKVNNEMLREHFRACFAPDRCRVVAYGNINDEVLALITEHFGRLAAQQSPFSKDFAPITPAQPGRYQVEKSGSVQTSIRMGKAGVHLTSEDYAGFMLLNTILGGYFGSRLMSNIREEKGYTYGINSMNVSMPRSSYWCVTTDVNNEHTEATLEEIRKEIRRLQQEPVGEEELALVKNFLHGDLLRELDGIFSQGEALKNKLNYSQDHQTYLNIIRKMKACTADELIHLANTYWNLDEMYIVTAGKEGKP